METTEFHWSTDPRDWWKQFWDRQQQANFLWHTNPRLDFLKQVLDSTDNWFNQVEAEFVRRSIERQRNNRRRTIGLVATGFAVVLGFAGLQRYQRQQAQIQTLIELSNASFASGQQLDALIAGLKAGKKLQTLRRLGLADADTQRLVVKVLMVAYFTLLQGITIKFGMSASVLTVKSLPLLVVTERSNFGAKTAFCSAP